MSRVLLFLESCLAIPVFIASWLICAIGFSAVAGYRMAKSSEDQKKAILAKAIGGKP